MSLQIKSTNAQDRHQFAKLIADVLDIIDDNLTQAMNDGNYLLICDKLKELFDFKNKINNDMVFILLNRARLQNRNVPVKPSLLEKANSNDYTNCNKCNRFIKNTQLDDHQQRVVCIQSLEAKHTTLIKHSKETSLHSKTQVLARALLHIMTSDEKWKQQQDELLEDEIEQI
jgi:hypothetical protein